MNRIVFFLICFGFYLSLEAQDFYISGSVREVDNAILSNCRAMLYDKKGNLVNGVYTDSLGQFRLGPVSPSAYDLIVNMIGFKELKQEVRISNEDILLKPIVLESNSLKLNEVQVKAKAPLSREKNDTTEFNASSAKVLKDASSEDLVSKMPSVTIENGQIKAQGEQVKQVLVDGKAYFGSDPTAALRNLPAEVVDKIQVFDQLSEQSRFSGVNDGNTTKTINIVTKSGMRQGQFGKIYAGYGFEEKYQGGGNLNYFDGDRRISIIGMSNNINVQNFSSEDITGLTGNADRGGGFGRGGGGRGPGGFGGGNQDFTVPSQGGLALTHAVGLNYSDKWGKKTEITGSYFFNVADNNIQEQITQEYFNTPIEIYNSTNQSDQLNSNHRFQARFEIKLDTMNSLILRPRVNIQSKTDKTQNISNTTLAAIISNQSQSLSKQTNNAYNLNNMLMWRHRFHKPARSLSIEWNAGYAPKKSESDLYSRNQFKELLKDSLDQIANSKTNNLNTSVQFEYTEPISALSQLVFTARSSFQEEESDKKTYDFVSIDQTYSSLNSSLSSEFSNDYFTNGIGAGYNYNKDKSLNFNARLNFQHSLLNNQTIFPAQTLPIQRQFFNVAPSFFMLKTFTPQSNLRLGYRPNVQLPTIAQLQDVLNNSNQLLLSVGNPELRQTVSHNLFARYQSSNIEKASTFFIMIGGGYTTDYIGSASYQGTSNHPLIAKYNVAPFARISQYVNLDNNYSLRSFVNYARPLIKLKTNINLDAGYTFSNVPGILDSIQLSTLNHTTNFGITLSSNISDKVDYSLSWRPTLNLSSTNLENSETNNFINQSAKLKLNWIILEGFVLRTDYTLSAFNYIQNSGDQILHIWNLGIGKKIFKNQRGEITFAVNDLLNQNKNISRNVFESYVQDVVTNSISRFFMLSLSYNLRNFNTGKKPTITTPNPQERDRMRPH